MKRFHGGRAFAALVLFVAPVVFPSGATLAQTVTSLNVNKERVFEQTSATNVLPRPASTPCVRCPHQFVSIVAGQNLASIPAPTLSGPMNAAGLGYVYAAWDGNWHFGGEQDWSAATEAELEARFGDGLYTITVNGTPVSLNLSGSYPDTPVLTLSGGAWVDGKYVIDAGQPLAISTNAFTTFGGNDAIFINLFQFGYVQSNPPGGNTLSHTVPANTFTNGNEYRIWATFASNVDWKAPAAAEFPGAYGVAGYVATTFVTIKAEAPPPVFPMTVTASIGPVTSNASALIQPRPQDVGTSASVFVFALAPANLVQGAQSPGIAETKSMGGQAKEGEAAVQCVLAQLSGAGQLVGVSASSLQAYVTGVLNAQQQAVTILNGVPTVNIGGAVFYVGYGTSPLDMVARGINQRAVAVPSANVCDPKPPQTGWWWNPLEDGRGYSIEARGRNLFFASFLYDLTGRSSWYVATGPWSLDGSLFESRLLSARGGQTLGGPYAGFPTLRDEGAITLAFNNALTGTLVWPGGAVPLQRFNIVPNGLSLPPVANQPQSGWWWNPGESGRGFFMEWQGGILNLAGYMYDIEGNPVWYLTQNATPTTNAQSFSSNWWSFGNGMTLMGPWRPHTRIDDNVAPVTIEFQGSENAIMTLPNGRTTAITRHRF